MNTKYATTGVIFIHSVPPAVRPHVEWAVSSVLGYEVHCEWTKQPALPQMYRAEISWTGEVGLGAVLASALGGWEHLRFEITEDPTAVSERRTLVVHPGTRHLLCANRLDRQRRRSGKPDPWGY